MRFQEMPKIKGKFKKGTSARKRKAFQRIANFVIRENWPKMKDLTSRMIENELIFGIKNNIKNLTWDEVSV